MGEPIMSGTCDPGEEMHDEITVLMVAFKKTAHMNRLSGAVQVAALAALFAELVGRSEFTNDRAFELFRHMVEGDIAEFAVFEAEGAVRQ